MVQNENKYGHIPPPRRTRPLPSIYVTTTRVLGPCLCLRSYQSKRSPLSPSRHSYRNCAVIFALASAEILHSRNTIDCLFGSYPCRGFQLRMLLVQKIRGQLSPYLCLKCPILAPLFTRHKLDRVPAEHGSLAYSSRFLAHLFRTERCVRTAVYALFISLRHRMIWPLLAPASAEPTHS